MKVTHITEETALRTTLALIDTVPKELRVQSTRQQLPALVESWIVVMTTEFRGYQWRADLGTVVKQH